MVVLCDVRVSYSQFTLGSRDDPTPDMSEAFSGQVNGLCGAAVPGALFFVTGLHTGTVPVTVEVLDSEPSVPAGWQDVVEVSFDAAEPTVWVMGWGGDSFDEVDLGAAGVFRVRYCARGFAVDREADHRPDDEPPVEDYLLQLWPASAAPDRVIASSAATQHWHDHARSLPPPPSSRDRAAAEQARAEQELAARERVRQEQLRREWGGRPPTARLLEVGGVARWVGRRDRDLLDAFEALDPGAQRRLARWLARRAFQHAGIEHVSGASVALEAMDRGDPLPAPFTDPAAASRYLWTRETGQPGPASVGIEVSVIPAPHPGWGEEEDDNIHRPSFALPAIFSAVEPDPLRAVIDTFSHTMATFRGHRGGLLDELRARFAE